MQTVTETYLRLLNTPGVIKQHKAVIGGVEYLQDSIVGEPRTENSLFGAAKGPTVGQTNAGQVEITVIPKGNIRRTARIHLMTRLVALDYATQTITEHSEWKPKGVFYIDTRRPDEASGTLTIHGYDAILLHGGETYLAEGDVGAWPRSADVVVNDLADRFGLELDERTVIDPSVLVPYPNDWTCRELLGFIGAAHAGNWTVTDVGKLRLVPLWSVPEETHYLVDQNGDPITFGGHRILLTSNVNQGPTDSGAGQVKLDRNMEQYGAPPAFEPFSRVTMWYDDENAFTAGDDTGRTLEVDCPIASQAIAEKVLAAIRGYAYQPYEAAGAILDPAAELGDGVSANGVYSVLASCTTTFDALMVSDIAAPADEEIDHEMPYESRTQLALKRKLTLGRNYYGAQITKTHGLQIVKTNAAGDEINRATFNTDLLAMYDDYGTARIYFDPTTGRYKFVGDIDISGGNINLAGGSITWGENEPDSGISASQAKTLITEQLVSSPTIAGAKFYSREANGSVGGTWIEIGTEGGPGAGYGLLLKSGGFVSTPVFGVYNGDFDSTAFSAKGFDFLSTDADTDTASPMGTWDFSNAEVNLAVAGSLPISAGDGSVAMRLDPENDRINIYVGGTVWALTADGLVKL